MVDPSRIQEVIDKLGEQPGESLTPETLEEIQTAMHEDLGRFIYNTSILFWDRMETTNAPP